MSSDPAFSVVRVRGAGSDDVHDAVARLARRCALFLSARGYRAAYEDLVPADLATSLSRMGGQPSEPIFLLRGPGDRADMTTVSAWTDDQRPYPDPEAGKAAVERLIWEIIELADRERLTADVQPVGHTADPAEWLGAFERTPHCLLVIVAPFDITPSAPPPPRMAPQAGDASSSTASLPVAGRRRDPRSRRDGLDVDASPSAGSVSAVTGNVAAGSGVIGAYLGRPAAPGWAPASRGGWGQRPPDLPKQPREEPLPHDGLFIRRNNAFGTKSTLGIADLIEQGVLIEQTQIRFDDFIASDTDGIPRPPAGEAAASSHGSARVPGGCKAYQGTTHFLEIALRAAEDPGDSVSHGEPLPVNFVFVVDTSASMTGPKLDIVKASLRQLYDQLRDSDILGVVTFDTQVRTVLKATPKAELPPGRLIDLVYGLQAGGGTDLNLGLLYGMDEITRHGSGNSDLVNCLYLFSDGDPTSGETDWIRIRSNVAEKLRGDLTISCFGFGSDARRRELEALAGAAGGTFTFVAQADDVRLNLAEDLTRREHLAAINIQLQIEIAPEISIWHLYGHDLITDPAAREAVVRDAAEARRRGVEHFGTQALPDLITEQKGIRIFAPDLAFGETYWIVFEIEVPDGADVSDAGRAVVQYVDTVARANRRHDLALTFDGEIPAATVAAHAIGLWTSEITFYALDDLYAQDRAAAKERLSRHMKVLRAAHKAMPVRQFVDDQVIMAKLISLSENLGRPMAWDDPGPRRGGAPLVYAMHTMNAFGQVRAGYNKVSYGG